MILRENKAGCSFINDQDGSGKRANEKIKCRFGRISSKRDPFLRGSGAAISKAIWDFLQKKAISRGHVL